MKPKMRHIIEFCVSNLASGTDKVKEALELYPDLDVVEYGCLGNCGECFTNPYALVNGDIISAETPDELLRKIKGLLTLTDINGEEEEKGKVKVGEKEGE